MTLQEFQSHPDWRMTFDVAFGLGIQDYASHDYTGPIQCVEEVLSASRGGPDQFAYAIVRFTEGTSSEPYALITSRRVGRNYTGDAIFYSQPPFEVRNVANA